MRSLIPALRYEVVLPEYMRSVIGAIYEHMYAHPKLICIGAKEGSLSMIFSVTSGFDKNQYHNLFNAFHHHTILYDVSDEEMIASGMLVVYSTQHPQYIDFLYEVDDYVKRHREILLNNLAHVKLKFDEYSMNLLANIAVQFAALNYSQQSGSIQALVFPVSDELLSFYLKSSLNSYEIRLILQYYAVPACGLPVSTTQYNRILKVVKDLIEGIEVVETKQA